MRTQQLWLAGALVAGLAATAGAQDWGRPAHPRSGACFYQDINFGGDYFCTGTGDENPRVPSGADNEISSIRLFGNAEVTVFVDRDMRGSSRRFTSSIRDLRAAGVNDKVSSYVVQPRSFGGSYGGAYGGGGWNSGGYSNGGYRGGHSDGYSGGYGGAYGGGSHWGSSNHSSGSRWTYREAEDIVRRAYERVLKRAPDPAARSWVNEVMKNNWSQRQLEDALRDTPEGRKQSF